MRFRSPAAKSSLLLLALPVLLGLPIQASTLKLIGASTIEEEALTFASGSATRYANTVNGRSHQQTPLTTYRGYQYATYFDSARRLCLARRKLPGLQWQIIRFQDHRFQTNDSHNTAVLGICHADGTIHLAFDHHATPLNYRVSKPGVAHHPESFPWDTTLFGKIRHTLGSVTADERVTYPRFFSAPNGNLMFYYRAGTSANGHGMIEEYNGATHDWTPGLGTFISRDLGTYTVDGRSSHSRCPYLNALSYAGPRLHVSWIWRDRFEKTKPGHNHDLCYAYSDDHGRTWHNSAGAVIGKTGTDPIHVESPGLVVAPIPMNTELSNQNTHYAYPDGSIHIMLRRRGEGSHTSTYHHHWRTNKGEWNSEALPFSGKRPKLVGTRDRTLVLLFADDEQTFVARGDPNPDRTQWTWSKIPLTRPSSICGEALLDLERWEKSQILSIYGQREPTQKIHTQKAEALDGVSSPLEVIDYRFQ